MGKYLFFNDALIYRVEIRIISPTLLHVSCGNRILCSGSVSSCINVIDSILKDLDPNQILSISKACAILNQIQETTPDHWCAKCVRNALDDAGLNYPFKGDAKSYHENGWLKAIGYQEINEPRTPLPGDISVQTYEPHGHICMYTGTNWVSDFVQNTPRGQVGKAYFYRLTKQIDFYIRNMNPNNDICFKYRQALVGRLNMAKAGYQNQVNIRVSMY